MSSRLKIGNSMFFVIAFLLVSTIPAFVYIFFNPETRTSAQQENSSGQNNADEENVKGVFDIATYPQIVNTPSPSIKALTRYDYYLKGLDSDTEPDKLLYRFKEGPEWLHIQYNHLYGTPTLKDVGTYKVVVMVSDGEHSTDKIFYLIVSE